MKKTILLTALLTTSTVMAKPATKHQHNGKFHTHVVPSLNHAHNGAKPKQAQKKGDSKTIPLSMVRKMIKSSALDPSSLKFGRFWLGKGNKAMGNQWCGYINGKNAYGGYTGDRLYIGASDISNLGVDWCKPVK